MPLPKKPIKTKLTPTQYINSIPELGLKEAVLFKSPRNPLVNVSVNRTAHAVDMTRKPFSHEKVLLHSHKLDTQMHVELPSTADFWKIHTFDGIRAHIISGIGSNKKVVGYTFLRSTKELKQNFHYAIEWFNLMRGTSIHSFVDSAKNHKIKLRFVPVKGYYFDKKEMTFKQKHNLKERSQLNKKIKFKQNNFRK